MPVHSLSYAKCLRVFTAAFSLLVALMAAAPGRVFAGPGEWTWMSGASTGGQPGVYGAQGVPDPANVPGERYESVSWTDTTGNLWLFGGNSSVSGALNDLWRYDVSTGLWTWMDGPSTPTYGVYGTQGVPAPANVPGARYGTVSWYDAGGQAWIFGGHGRAASGLVGVLNDLWRYDPTSGEWTWMSGATSTGQPGVYGALGTPAAGNVPGARLDSVSWIDASGGLWLFGGGLATSAPPLLNDLWRYDPASGHWAWMGGASVTNQPGVYGTQGTPAATNVPGAREDAIAWSDGSGGLWLFGGRGYDSSGQVGLLNDLWRYDIAAGQWTWISGSSLRDQLGVYGVQGVADPANAPGGRSDSVVWVDSAGDLWTFGGYGRDSGGAYRFLNDLWRYSPVSGLWTWVSGSNLGDQVGVYGTLGSPDPANAPGGRRYAVAWTGSADSLWLFGGRGKDGTGAAGYTYMNDLWRYEPGAPLAVTLASFDAAVQADHILVSWETVSELDNAGFNLYRGASDDWNSATLLTFVPSQAPGSAQGFSYAYQDFDVQPGQTVWYWLEDIDLSGAATRHGPVSALLQAPTAVSLGELAANAGATSPPLWPLAAVLLMATAAAASQNVVTSQAKRAFPVLWDSVFRRK